MHFLCKYYSRTILQTELVGVSSHRCRMIFMDTKCLKLHVNLFLKVLTLATLVALKYFFNYPCNLELLNE